MYPHGRRPAHLDWLRLVARVRDDATGSQDSVTSSAFQRVFEQARMRPQECAVQRDGPHNLCLRCLAGGESKAIRRPHAKPSSVGMQLLRHERQRQDTFQLAILSWLVHCGALERYVGLERCSQLSRRSERYVSYGRQVQGRLAEAPELAQRALAIDDGSVDARSLQCRFAAGRTNEPRRRRPLRRRALRRIEANDPALPPTKSAPESRHPRLGVAPLPRRSRLSSCAKAG